jgi:hypothetical protein
LREIGLAKPQRRKELKGLCLQKSQLALFFVIKYNISGDLPLLRRYYKTKSGRIAPTERKILSCLDFYQDKKDWNDGGTAFVIKRKHYAPKKHFL